MTLPVLGPIKTEKIFLLFLTVAVFATFVLLIEGRLILKLVPLQVAGLNKIGLVKFIRGNAFRKLKNDSLHLPLKTNDLVYEEDLITTEESSSLEILLLDRQLDRRLDSGNSLLQEPNTILRLSRDRSSLLLQLQSGGVSTQFSDDILVKVQTGTMTKELQIRKGTYLIKNSSRGIQITAFDSNIAVKKTINTLEEEKETKKVYKADSADIKDDKKSDTDGDTASKVSANEDFDMSKFTASQQMPLRLPYPEEQQVFLLTDKATKRLVLLAKKNCEGACYLQIACGQEVLYGKKLASGTTPIYALEIKKEALCSEYSWKFSDDKDNFERRFSVESYSDEVFQKYMNLGRPIEML